MARFVRVWIPIHLSVLVLAYAALWIQSGNTLQTIIDQWFFVPVGILGAIIANATGTGGGVVFVPIFAALDLPGETTVALAFAIQCFGMSIGSLVWAHAIFVKDSLAWDEKVTPQTLMALTAAPLATGVPTLLLTQAFVSITPADVITYFKFFSLALGIILLIFTWVQRRQLASQRKLYVTPGELWVLLGLGVIGGFVTALFSVGIGEFLAVYLILRRFPTKVAIAVAVWVSVVCVFAGFWKGYLAGHVALDIALIAIPGAILGGFVAKGIASLLGSLWLKTLASIWIIASSIYLLLT